MNIKSIVLLSVLILSLYLTGFIGVEVLPDGWAETPFTHWWTLPTVVVLCSIPTFIFIKFILEIVWE